MTTAPASPQGAAFLLSFLALAAHGIRAADCNENCITDAEEVLQGSVEDCNGNGIPDECDLKQPVALFVAGPYVSPAGWMRSIRAADMDADGRPDLVTADSIPTFDIGSGMSIHWGAGAVKLEGPSSVLLSRIHPETLDTADLDLDGDPDVALVAQAEAACAERPDRVAIIENLGGRTLAAPASFDAGHGTRDLVAADMDGDGDADLVIGEQGPSSSLAGVVTVHVNRGDASFEPGTRIEFPGESPEGIDAADLDRDGDLDLALVHGSRRELMSILRNHGDGSFGPAEPLEAPPHLSGVIAEDLDSDGDVDLVLTQARKRPGFILVLMNSGGTAAWEPLEIDGFADSVATADLDADGRRELLAARGSLDVLHLGTGTPRPSRYAVLSNFVHLVAPADMDGDGDEDVVAAVEEVLSIVENQGGSLVAPRSILDRAGRLLKDLDGDADLDIAAITTEGIEIVRNAGPRSFPIEGLHPVPNTGKKAFDSIAAGDLDADLDQDIVAILRTGDVEIHRNPGDGMFPGTQESLFHGSPHGGRTGSVVLADLDQDGDLDAATTLLFFTVSLILNLGDGTLLNGERLPVIADPRALVAADLDGDGRPDLLTGNVGESFFSVSVLANRGGGVFDIARNFAVEAQSTWLQAGDIDGDGDIDAVTNGISVLENRGDGIFHPSRRVEERGSLAGALADLDGDLDLDLATTRELFLNRGDGRFDARSRTAPVPGYVLLAGDLDGDTNMDLMEGAYVTWGAGGAALAAPDSVQVPGLTHVQDEFLDRDRDGYLEIGLGAAGHVSFLELEEGASHAALTWQRVVLGRGIQAFASADLDRDGSSDLAFVSASCWTCTRSLTVLLDRGGAGTRETVLDLQSTDIFSDMDAADLDGDGDLDIAAFNVSSYGSPVSGVSIFLNDGGGAFSARDLPEAFDVTGHRLEAVDLDGDGDLDIVTNGILVYTNDGSGRFGGPAHVPEECCGLVVGDLDSDGDPDIVTNSSVLVNVDGSPGLQSRRHGSTFVNVAGPADLDGDGTLDVIGLNSRNDGRSHLSLLRNDGAGRLEPFAWLPVRFSVYDMYVVDANADGRPDVVTETTLGMQVHWNRIASPIPTGVDLDRDSDGSLDRCQPPRFTRGDVTGDGAVDIADAISLLLHLFLGGPEPGCLEAADANDDTEIVLSDAVHLLLYLFQGGPPPSLPGPDFPCFRDLDEDGIECSVQPAC